MKATHALIFAAAFALPAIAIAQDKPPREDGAAQPVDDHKSTTVKDAGEVVSQPVRDVGVTKTKIPPVLIEAAEDPYGLYGLSTCALLANDVRALNEELGPDLIALNPGKKTSVAKAGGAAVVNSLIPFRGVVREISGAAAADRRLAAATEAGFARRGFLRGVYETRRCRPAL